MPLFALGDPPALVIDPATLAVNRTLSLPRASQPHGLVMSPAGDFAYVSLEATGQLRRYSTSNYSTLATIAETTYRKHPIELVARFRRPTETK